MQGIPAFILPFHFNYFTTGELPEWPIGAVSKTVIPAMVSRVRIPDSPQTFNAPQKRSFLFEERCKLSCKSDKKQK
jgi:hypothetical protein